MFLRPLDLTSALRPSLNDDETLLFVQDGVGLYEGKYKLTNYQDGHAYLTSHRVCYVDNKEPRKYSVAVDLKEIDRTEFYAGFLKSSAKITLIPKPLKQPLRGPVSRHGSPAPGFPNSPTSPTRSFAPSPAPPRETNATWICPICGQSSAVPNNFDPATANQHTPLPPCQTCGVKPPLITLVKAAIAAMSNRTSGVVNNTTPTREYSGSGARPGLTQTHSGTYGIVCARCTFENHPSLTACELCGAPLSSVGSEAPSHSLRRPESPGPATGESIVNNDTIETIKFAFRAGGEKTFLDRLKNALVQRRWLLHSAPPVPRPGATPISNGNATSTGNASPSQRVVGIAGLEQRGAMLRQMNQAVIGSAFEDLEALMTSAKEVIAMAEQFRAQSGAGSDNMSAEARMLLSDSASALGLTTTKDMLGSGSSSDNLYITELSRTLAEFLTDDRRGILRREGGIISLVDLWAVFNRTRNGIELVSPLDFERAARTWDTLHLPIRLRQFKSGSLVVQERSRTDDKTIAALLAWLQEPQYEFPPSHTDEATRMFGRGVTALETAEKFHWSIGVATEELEMAEEAGALCRDQCLDGIRFWENQFARFAQPKRVVDALQMINELKMT